MEYYFSIEREVDHLKEKQQLDLEILLLNGLTLYKQIQIV
ncbi:hypothetical protein PARMER_00985 [Parabacteroides merdae ATCC 43184]|nr:hypothetical protein PARMER_00985 [Parabacteroides merdae ATCC 43184]